MDMNALYTEIERLKDHFDAIDKDREVAYQTARELRRLSVQAVREVHQGKTDNARVLVEQGRELASRLAALPTRFGFTEEAMQEYCEAAFTIAFLHGEPIPTQAELGADERGYLLGLADAIGEIRRHILDLLRDDGIEKARELLDLMDDIFGLLLKFDHTEAVVPVRRKQDGLRGLIERTHADLSNIICQKRLETCIREATKG